MTLDVLTANALSAESLAEKLSHWQVMDIVFVANHRGLQLGAARPWRPLDQLIQWGVLKYSSEGAKHLVLVPSHRFKAVLAALVRSGRIGPTPSSPMPSAQPHVEP